MRGTMTMYRHATAMMLLTMNRLLVYTFGGRIAFVRVPADGAAKLRQRLWIGVSSVARSEQHLDESVVHSLVHESSSSPFPSQIPGLLDGRSY